MQSPFNPLVYVILGFLTASLPYFGFPSLWETFFEVGLGGFLVTIGAVHWWQRRSQHMHEADTFVESRREEHFKSMEIAPLRTVVSPMSDVSVRHTPPVTPQQTPSPIMSSTAAPVAPMQASPASITMADVVATPKKEMEAAPTILSRDTARSSPKGTKPRTSKTPQKTTPAHGEAIPSPVRIRSKRRTPTKTSTALVSR